MPSVRFPSSTLCAMKPRLVEHQGGDGEKLDKFLSDRIYEFNSLAIACFDGKLFGYAQNEVGQVVAGVSGHTWAGFCRVTHLWLSSGPTLGYALRCPLLSNVGPPLQHEERTMTMLPPAGQAVAPSTGSGLEKVLGGLSIVTMLMTVPQLLAVWVSHSSLISWVAYLVSACLWFAYGVRKSDKTVYRACIGWIVLDTA
jgi:hypothetical protein